MGMANSTGRLDNERPLRAISPALSEASELTILSRSPSPVPGYNSGRAASNVTPVDTRSRLRFRGMNGRFKSQKRPLTPTRNNDSMMMTPRAPKKLRKRYFDSESPPPKPESLVPWAVGIGGFGTLQVLPTEIRQMIYSYAFGVDRPVKLRSCCGPESTRRERDICRKHDSTIGRFNVLHLSKAINDEASWVLYNQGSLHIDVNNTVTPYLDGSVKSVRQLGKSVANNKRKMTIWAIAARYRFITLHISESNIRHYDPTRVTGHLLEIACLLGKAWEGNQTPSNFIQLDLGVLFHQMLPFNVESQADEKYDELVNWLCTHCLYNDRDLGQIATESEQNMKKLACVMGMHGDRSQWKVLATAVLDEDEGGAKALRTFQESCARIGVHFEYKD